MLDAFTVLTVVGEAAGLLATLALLCLSDAGVLAHARVLSARFLGTGTMHNRELDWTALRDRWEYSHVARAGASMPGLILLVTAVTLDSR
jgi:hypothetical protein